MTEKLHLLQPLSSSSNINMSQAHQTMYIPIQQSNPDSESAYFFSSQLEEGDSPILTDDSNNVNSQKIPIGLLTPSIIKQRHPSSVPITPTPPQEKTFILSTTPRTDLYQHFNPFSSIQEFISYSNTESSNSSINNKVYSEEISSHKKENNQHMNTIPRMSSHDYGAISHKRRHSSPIEFNHKIFVNSAPVPIVATQIPITITNTNNNTILSSKCYAGGAFHNSPAPDTLPIPEFITVKATHTQSKSVPVSPKLTAKPLPSDKTTVFPPSPLTNNVNTSPKMHPQNRKVKSPPNKNKPSPKLSPSNENFKGDRVRNKSNHKPKANPTQLVDISAAKYTELLANDLRRMLNIVPAQVI